MKTYGVGGPASSMEAAPRCTELNWTVGPTLKNGGGGPASSMEAAPRCTELNWTVGPTLKNGVGGPASSIEAAPRCTELNWTVGPTLKNVLVLILSLFVAAVAAQAQGPATAQPNAAPAPTPRLANGKPDLTGSWQGAGGGQQGSGGDMFRRCTPFQSKNCMEWTNQSEDWVFMSATRLDQRQPLYKPEHWDKIIELDQWTNKYDPVMTCLPLGIPRQGPPARIFHTENDITMIYRGGIDGGGGYAEFRMIPIDGKPHDPRRAALYTYMGYTVGRWEGDTLVLDSIGFSDETWLGRGGFFHSDQMRVIEKFTRTGNQMLYEITIEDPEVLVQPWVMPSRTLRLSNGNTIIPERGSCTETELKEVSSQMRH